MRRNENEFIPAISQSSSNLEHYSPRDIRFNREQTIWLITWLDVIGDGHWPPDPKETGYVDVPGGSSHSHSHRSPFETSAQIYAEVTTRLEQTGDAGVTLVWEVQHGLEVYELLSPPAKRALNYISGWRRRRQSFSQWCYDQRKKSENNQKQ
jgi:hypothetical protein